MINQGKNIVIGLFVIAALTLLIFILLYLHPTVGDMAKTLHVRFNNIDKINVGTRVNLAGKAIGEVTAIHEVPGAREEEAKHPNQPVYIYELTLKVDSGIKIYDSDIFSASTSGLLGEKSVEVTPAPPKKGHTMVLLNSEDIILATPSGTIEEVFKGFSTLSKKVETALDSINGQLLEINKKKIWENIANTAQNLSDITRALNQPTELTSIVKNISDFAKDLGPIKEKVNKMMDNFLASSEHFSTVTGRLNRGEGSFGRLLKDDDFYLRVSSVMSKADTLMDDISHYGLLFQNNKAWQRLRARRLNLLTKLSSPQEFRNYFNDEIDQITSSLSRVNMVLQESDQCMPEEVITSREFGRVFAELLRRVKNLEENLMLYDQQVVEIREKEMYHTPKSVVEKMLEEGPPTLPPAYLCPSRQPCSQLMPPFDY